MFLCIWQSGIIHLFFYFMISDAFNKEKHCSTYDLKLYVIINWTRIRFKIINFFNQLCLYVFKIDIPIVNTTNSLIVLTVFDYKYFVFKIFYLMFECLNND